MSKRFGNPVIWGVGLLVALIVASLSISIVPETKQAIVLRYGQPIWKVNVYEEGSEFGGPGAGIFFRIPFIEQIQFFDKRVLNVEMSEPQEVLSTDKLRLQVDAYARFRITDPLQMFRSIQTEERLSEQLRTILGSSLRNELGKRSFAQLLSPERGQIMENVQTALNIQANKYGAEVIDVRIKRADLPEGTPLDSAFTRMRSERQQEATAIRASGQREASIIRGQAEAESARIYAESFGKDPEFYDFYRAMQSYEQTFVNGKGDSSIVLSPNSEYLRQFRGRK